MVLLGRRSSGPPEVTEPLPADETEAEEGSPDPQPDGPDLDSHVEVNVEINPGVEE